MMMKNGIWLKFEQINEAIVRSHIKKPPYLDPAPEAKH